MDFFNRKDELKLLSDIRERSLSASQMTIIIGRRRIGKTRLIRKSLENKEFLYFFVSRKNESLLCEEYINQVKEILNIPVFGSINKIKDLFGLILEEAKKQPINLVIDEFQEFKYVNPAIYGEIQDVWDRTKDYTQLNLILCGSVYSLMKKIFEHSKEPLFGRITERIHLSPFEVDELKSIFFNNNSTATNRDLLAFYIITGGVAKYVEHFIDRNYLQFSTMLDEIFRDNSLFLEEGRNLLIEEFGKDYLTYFSILSLIATGKTSRQEIESILRKDIGGYLDNLETEYNIISKIRPVLSKPASRTVKYSINDNFLSFWFRFIYRNQSAVEIHNYDFVKEIVKRDFDSFSGKMLEKYFIQKLASSKKYNIIGNYWERGNKNEIDIVAVNSNEKYVLFGEVKINKKKIDINKLKGKSYNLLQKFPGYSYEYKGFSVEDM